MADDVPAAKSMAARTGTLLVIGLGMGVLGHSLTQMMVVPALPAIAHDLGAGPTAMARSSAVTC